MTKNLKVLMVLVVLAVLTGCQSVGGGTSGGAVTAADIEQSVDSALARLYASTPAAKTLAKRAKGILVFPGIVKGGFVFGGQYGKGALRQRGRTAGYYNIVAGSYGLQAGAQSFDYAMFFMTQHALNYLNNSAGWEIGVGPGIVIVDEGIARTLTTTTAQDDVYAFIFGQRGLMAGLGLQGSKITRINP